MTRIAQWIYFAGAVAIWSGFQAPAFAQLCNNDACPPCFYDGVSLGGFVPSSGRLAINVYIDSSWDVSPGVTNSNVYNGVSSSITRWNAATTTQCANRLARKFTHKVRETEPR